VEPAGGDQALEDPNVLRAELGPTVQQKSQFLRLWRAFHNRNYGEFRIMLSYCGT
jgi:hypothetical protein